MMLECLFDSAANPPNPPDLYTQIKWPEAPISRPYVYINMAATVDGKIVVGEIGGTAKGVGGPTDQILFRRLQTQCDAALIGSSTLRASNVIYPPNVARFVVTGSGDVPLENRFFTDAPERAFVIAPEDLPADQLTKLRAKTNVILTGRGEVNLVSAMQILKFDHGIKVLLCEGGANLNSQLIRAGLADELFLTVAPKLKGGAQLPTIVEGEGFPPGMSLPLILLSIYRDGDELYLRYRIAPIPTQESNAGR